MGSAWGWGWLGAGLSNDTVVFGREGGSWDAVLGRLTILASEPGEVRVCLTRVDDYWEFAAGVLEQRLVLKAGRAYYLGTLVLDYGEGRSIDVLYPEGDHLVVGALPRSPSNFTPRKRYLLCGIRVVDDEESARRFLRAELETSSIPFENRTRDWVRVSQGTFWGKKKARPVQVIEP